MTFLALVLAALPAVARAASEKKRFDISAGLANETLKQFSAQTGADERLLYSADSVDGVKTKAVKGEMKPREALDRMLVDTVLTVVEDARTRTLMVTRPSPFRKPATASSADPKAQTQSDEPQKTMKQKNPVALLAGWIALALAPAHLTKGADGSTAGVPSHQLGSVNGRVMNAATGDYLAGATIEIVGTDISMVTDLGGNFHVTRVPAGPQRVSVKYTGLNSAMITTQVLPGQTADVALVKLTADIYQMEKMVVGGLREGNALAITFQKNADNVKNVVAADTFGNISDGNPGDLLQYLPGVSADYVGNEVRTIQIRGMAPEMGSVTMDGTRMASSQSANLGRQFEYETASLGNIETVELNKALLPDMEADAVSGSVNLRTKSPLDGSPDRRIAFNIGATMDPENNVPGYSDTGVSGSFKYSDVFGRTNNFGVVFSSSYHKSDSPAFLAGSRYQTTTGSPAYTFQVIAPRPAPGPRERISNNLKFEYQVNERARVDVRFGYNTMLETSHPREFVIQAANSVATLNAAGQPAGTGGILPGYTDLVSEARQLATTRASFTVQRFPKRGRTFIFGSGGRYRAEGFELTWNGSYSYSQTRYHRT
ncbi:MAG: carboxypeptidase-like regulatory domain-containing protein, partial [Opitutaceae bacterium]